MMWTSLTGYKLQSDSDQK